MTEKEYIQLYELLEKFVDNCDMTEMHLCQKAKELLKAFNEL